ncbi:Retrovirus-related Pol polyprotein from transposon TNT 1-94 [Bienertia sinuspersici]
MNPSELAIWQRLDDIVRQWIYGTISKDLLNSILDADDKAIDTWDRLENFFHNNKSTRALHLDSQFTNTKLDQFDGVKSYCTRLKDLADSLKNVGDTVSDNRMALQLLKGLSDEYKQFRTSVRHLKPLPSFAELRSMLELEEQSNQQDLVSELREEAHLTHSSVATPAPVPNSSSSTSAPHNKGVVAKVARGRAKGKVGRIATPTINNNILVSNSSPFVALHHSSSLLRGTSPTPGVIGHQAHGPAHPVRTHLRHPAQLLPGLLLRQYSRPLVVFLGLVPHIKPTMLLLLLLLLLKVLCRLILIRLCTPCPWRIQIIIWIRALPLT